MYRATALCLQCYSQLHISVETRKVLEKKESMLGQNSLQLFLDVCTLAFNAFLCLSIQPTVPMKEILYQQIQIFKFYYANSSHGKAIFHLFGFLKYSCRYICANHVTMPIINQGSFLQTQMSLYDGESQPHVLCTPVVQISLITNFICCSEESVGSCLYYSGWCEYANFPCFNFSCSMSGLKPLRDFIARNTVHRVIPPSAKTRADFQTGLP